MARNKMTVDFTGIERLKLELLELGNWDLVHRAFDNALEESQKIVGDKVKAAMATHNNTGKTQRSIVTDTPPKWRGNEAEIDVGFNISNGGLASIFLMYGTQLYGQPHIKPDKNLYNAVYGAATQKQVKEIQRQAFQDLINKTLKGG